jgi:transaldolase/glucose-6-phosphate isomerase
MIRSCGPDVPPAENPGVTLGIVLGAAAARGRDKVTMLASPTLRRFGGGFGVWAEQLFAESTGKQAKA